MSNVESPKGNEWIVIIKQNPNESLKLVYKTYQDEFVKWLKVSYSCDDEDAHDFFQETVIALYRNIVTGKLTELTSSLKTYLFSIGKYIALKAKLKPKKANVEDMEQVANWSPDENLYLKQLEVEELEGRKKRMLEGLQKLKDPCKSILFSYYYERLNLKQIAEKMGYNNSEVVKTQKYRCMGKFLKAFK